jgi:hypothetical protein
MVHDSGMDALTLKIFYICPCERDKIGTALDPQESTAPISPPAPQLREVGATLVFSKKIGATLET